MKHVPFPSRFTLWVTKKQKLRTRLEKAHCARVNAPTSLNNCIPTGYEKSGRSTGVIGAPYDNGEPLAEARTTSHRNERRASGVADNRLVNSLDEMRDITRAFFSSRGATSHVVSNDNYFAVLPVVNCSWVRYNSSEEYHLCRPTVCKYGVSKRYWRKKVFNKMKNHRKISAKENMSDWQCRLYESQAYIRHLIQEEEIMRVIDSQEDLTRLSINTELSKSQRKRIRRRIRLLSNETEYWRDTSSSSDGERIESQDQEMTGLYNIALNLDKDTFKHVTQYMSGWYDDDEFVSEIYDQAYVIRERRKRSRNMKRKYMRNNKYFKKWKKSMFHVNYEFVTSYHFYRDFYNPYGVLLNNTNYYDEQNLPKDLHVQGKEDADNGDTFFKRQFRAVMSKVLIDHVDNLPGNVDVPLFFENLLDTLIMMYKQQNIYDALFALKIYISLRYQISIGTIIMNYLKQLFAIFEVQGDDGEKKVPFSFKSLFLDWKGFYHGEMLSKLVKAVACVFSLGLCNSIKLPFDLGKFEKNFKDDDLKNKSWPDLITCIIDVGIHVFEQGYKWISGRIGFMDIFRSQSSSLSYDEEFSLITNNINLYETNELYRINMDKYQYEFRYHELYEITKRFYDSAGLSSEKSLMRMNLRKLGAIANKMVLVNSTFTLREAPFAYYLYGASSVGKSTLVDILNNALLRANGLDPDPKYQVSINASDSYQSEVQPYHLVIGCDDIANIKAEHEEGNSMKIVLDYVGNTAVHALKADVDSKGKVLLKPKIFHSTTNVKNVEAHVKSNEPLAILRRLGICITVTVRKEFRKPGSHMLDPSKMVDVINDAWIFTVEEAKPNLHDNTSLMKRSSMLWHPFEFEGKKLVDIDLATLIRFLVYKSKIHYVQQKRLVDSVEKVQKTDLCLHDTYKSLCAECRSLDDISIEVHSKYYNASFSELDVVAKLNRCWHYVYDFLPHYVLDRPGISAWLEWFGDGMCIIQLKKALNVTCLIVTAQGINILINGGIIPFMIFVIALLLYVFIFYLVLLRMHSEYTRIRDNVIGSLQPLVENKYKILGGLGATIAIVAILRSLRKHSQTVSYLVTAQGNTYVTPKPDENFKPNEWLKPTIERPKVHHIVETTTKEQLSDMVTSGLAHANFTDDCGHGMKSNIFPLKGNVWLVNYHVIARYAWTRVQVKRRSTDVSINRTCILHKSMWQRIGDTDMAIITLSSLGENRDLIPYLPQDFKHVYEPVDWYYKDSDANVIRDSFRAKFQRVIFTDKGNNYDYYGWKYDMNITPKEGQCMSPIISKGLYPIILGFHSAGSATENIGIAHIVTQNEVNKHIDLLFSREIGKSEHINVQVHSSGTMKLDFPDYNIKLQQGIHDKSPFNFFEQPACVALYGRHSGSRRTFRSAVQKSIISDKFTELSGISNNYGPPRAMNSWLPWRADALKVTKTVQLDVDPLIMAYNDMESMIYMFLESNLQYKEKISPMSRVATLSGVDMCRGIDAIKLSTSAGFPRCRPKREYVHESEEIYEFITRPLEADQDIWDEVDRCHAELAAGRRVHFIHRINLKDEPTKITKEKVRTFAGCTLECLILIRMYFLPIAKMIMENSKEFECAVGVNAHGPEWTDLTHHMQRFGSCRTIAGDYANYDSEMWCHMVLLTFALMIFIAMWAGYSDEQIMVMQGIMTELSYGLTEFNGDYAEFLAQMLSGHGMTVFNNSFGNSLYMRFAYYAVGMYYRQDPEKFCSEMAAHMSWTMEQMKAFVVEYDLDSFLLPQVKALPMFHREVSLMCYGDDNKMSVRDTSPWFNHCTISFVLAKNGVTYTMADKTSISVPYINSSECSFLKRHSVWDKELNNYLAPLEMDSLWKTIHSNVVSKNVSREQQSAESVDSVVRELFYHGRDTFDKWVPILQKVIEDCDLCCYFDKGKLFTYDELRQTYVQKYLCPPDIKNEYASETFDEVAKNVCTQLDTKRGENEDGISPLLGFVCHGSDSYLGMDSPVQKPLPHAVHNLKTHVELFEIATNNNMNNNGTASNNVGTLMGAEKHQTMVFRDGTTQWSSGIAGGYEDTRKVAIDDSVPLEEFCSRPIKVTMPEWTPGSVVPYTFISNPWNVFFTNKRVANRVSNYNLAQCTMKVKIVINGNGFYFGRLMADYMPLPAYNTVDTFNTLQSVNIVQASQRAHIYINPTSSQGGEIECPFIWPNNALRLPEGDFVNMGNITVREVNALKHANGSTTPVSLTMYVWAENMRLAVPTTRNISGLTTQGDEYASSPISNIASTVAQIAGRLMSVPIIAPYAKATQMISTAIGGVAKILGYARPADISDAKQMKPRLISRLANVDCGDMVTKLSMDSKQELSIDPRIVGLDGHDSMSIASIAGIESFLTTFPWTTTKTSDDLLWNTRVTPSVGRLNPATTGTSYILPACAYAQLPFQYWRGTMRYRFQIVCSEYHRGRLRFTYDPGFVVGNETNIGFSRIIDLCDETDFTIDISWGQAQTFLLCSGINSGIEARYGTTLINNFGGTDTNGVLGVYVVNDLTTPNSVTNNDIEINVSVSMCDDVEFAAPHDRIETYTFTPQGEETDEANVNDNAPVMTSNDDQILECDTLDHTNDVYFGEVIKSFRSLMRRYTYHSSILLTNIVADTVSSIIIPDFPTQRGINLNGIHTNATAVKCYQNRLTIVNFLAPAFLAFRGSMRWKYVQQNNSTSNGENTNILWHRRPVSTGIEQNIFTNTLTTTNASTYARTLSENRDGTTAGCEIIPLVQQPITEIELPYYNNERFSTCKNIGNDTNVIANTFFPYKRSHQFSVVTFAGGRRAMDAYCAAGEDASFHLFQGCPPIGVYVPT